MKVWDGAGIELATPGSAVRLASVERHITYCATRPGSQGRWEERETETMKNKQAERTVRHTERQTDKESILYITDFYLK